MLPHASATRQGRSSLAVALPHARMGAADAIWSLPHQKRTFQCFRRSHLNMSGSLPRSGVAVMRAGCRGPLSAGRGRRRTTPCPRAGSSPWSSGSRSTRRSPFSCGSPGRRSPTCPSRYEHLCSRWCWCHGWSFWRCRCSSVSSDRGCVGADEHAWRPRHRLAFAARAPTCRRRSPARAEGLKGILGSRAR
jgi:hypothetical protein